MKECNKCHQLKPLDQFHKNKWNKDGYQTYCKNCQKIVNKHYKVSERLTNTYCLYCGKQTRNDNKYCSSKCRKQYNWGQIKKYIDETGQTVESIDSGDWVARRRAKQYLLEKTGNICALCGFSEWQGQLIPLNCDHIDGDPTNLNINNFRLICPNCDALLDTYKAKNRGNGRSSKGLHP